ncbi:sulfate ABC transporter substrate-binding protein [Phycisphaerales bacterium AB-hyl4]|uniref:Sulfate ABC transporter substrate-binding protein n=1 Tax=Natronomicrosphaera hydrolytica TaxID=3242702 RepID=A0ABV4U6E1_9BACT
MKSLRTRAKSYTLATLAGAALLGSLSLTGCGDSEAATDRTILNVSYDPTRELYREFNQAFAEHWYEQTGERVRIRMSHGGSGGQSRAVIDGLEADVVTLALAADIDAIAERTDRLPRDWQGKLPHNNAPYSSTLAFLVRKGNPKNIHTWEDLTRSDVEVITPNPKTSGVARWNYLAMWGAALQRELGPDFVAKLNDPAHADEVASAQQAAQAFVAAIYNNVPVLDTAARGATNTFIQRGLGDVLINWENEILLGSRELDEAGLEMVVPPVSILAEPTVALVERNAERHGTTDVAQAYLEYLYTDVGQDLAGRYYYRPVAEAAQEKYRDQFPDVEMFTIDDVFGGWDEANRVHFRDGGTFDQIYTP